MKVERRIEQLMGRQLDLAVDLHLACAGGMGPALRPLFVVEGQDDDLDPAILKLPGSSRAIESMPEEVWQA